MPSHCLALLLSLVSSCTLPWSPVKIRVSIPPQPDLCVHYAARPPLCLSAVIARLEAHRLV